MLTIELSGNELWDETAQQFFHTEAKTVRLEHSLVSLSKWESIHKVPFLDGKAREPELVLSYIQCMDLDGNLTAEDLLTLTSKQFDEIISYIETPQTATTFSNVASRGRSEIITSELIYYWMVAYTIPFECQSWHLTRLLTLIRICNVKQSKPKKMSRSELAAQTRSLNEKRRRELGTTG